MKSVSQLLAATCALTACTLHAAPSNDDLQREIDQLKLRVDRVTDGSSLHTDKTADSPAGIGMSLSADALFWQTQADTTQYSLAVSQNVPTQLPSNINIQNQSIDWSWGFKVGAGYTFDHDNWKLDAEYTWFRPEGKSRDTYPTGTAGGYSIPFASVGVATVFSENAAPMAKNVSSYYKLTYDFATLELSRSFCVSRKIDFTTHLGLAGGWLKNLQQTRFWGGTQADFISTNNILSEQITRFWGIGPRAGIASTWHLGLGFSINGDVTAEVLTGKFDISNRSQGNGSTTLQTNVTSDFYSYRPQFFYDLGLGYDAYFNDAQQHLAIRANWETQVWMNQLYLFSESFWVNTGDLMLSGLTFKVLVDF